MIIGKYIRGKDLNIGDYIEAKYTFNENNIKYLPAKVTHILENSKEIIASGCYGRCADTIKFEDTVKLITKEDYENYN